MFVSVTVTVLAFFYSSYKLYLCSTYFCQFTYKHRLSNKYLFKLETLVALIVLIECIVSVVWLCDVNVTEGCECVSC